MKKFTLSSKSKRSLIAIGSAFISVGAVTLFLQMNTGAAAEKVAVSSSERSVSTEVSVPEIIVVSTDSSSASAFVPSSGASEVVSMTAISKPSSAPSKPVIQGESKAVSSALTNKSSKPTYSSKPAASKKATTTPKNGEVRNGKTYVDGFGWIDGTPQSGETTVVSGDWGEGSEVGNMD